MLEEEADDTLLHVALLDLSFGVKVRLDLVVIISRVEQELFHSFGVSSCFVPLHDNLTFSIDCVSDLFKLTDVAPSIEVVSRSISCLMVYHPSKVLLFEFLFSASELQVMEE